VTSFVVAVLKAAVNGLADVDTWTNMFANELEKRGAQPNQDPNRALSSALWSFHILHVRSDQEPAVQNKNRPAPIRFFVDKEQP
jgi:hypothetical protein